MARLGTRLSWIVLVAACGSSHDRDGDGTDAGLRLDGATRDSAVGPDSGGRRDAGSVADWGACTANPQCIVRPASCCGACGAAVPSDMVGVNQARVTDQRADACTEPIACPECFMQQDPHLVATCAAGRCEAIDLRPHPVTACTTDDDCFLASPNCCDCGELGEGEAIAISDAAGLAELRCDPSFSCPPCVPIFADDLRPYCDPSTRHCRIAIVTP